MVNKLVIYYLLLSLNLFSVDKKFDFKEFDPLNSDVYYQLLSVIQAPLMSYNIYNELSQLGSENNYVKLREEKCSDFLV